MQKSIRYACKRKEVYTKLFKQEKRLNEALFQNFVKPLLSLSNAERRTLSAVTVLRFGIIAAADLNGIERAEILLTSVMITGGDVTFDIMIHLVHIRIAPFMIAITNMNE